MQLLRVKPRIHSLTLVLHHHRPLHSFTRAGVRFILRDDGAKGHFEVLVFRLSSPGSVSGAALASHLPNRLAHSSASHTASSRTTNEHLHHPSARTALSRPGPLARPITRRTRRACRPSAARRRSLAAAQCRRGSGGARTGNARVGCATGEV